MSRNDYAFDWRQEDGRKILELIRRLADSQHRAAEAERRLAEMVGLNRMMAEMAERAIALELEVREDATMWRDLALDLQRW